MLAKLARHPLVSLVAGSLVAACGSSPEPTKAQLGRQLTELATALQASDVDTAAEHMMLPPDRSLEEMKPMLPRLVVKREISAEGVKLLLEKGTFGKLVDVFPERGPKRAERLGVNVEECWAMSLDRAEVMARWTGKGFKIFRLDDVGRLGPEAVPPATTKKD